MLPRTGYQLSQEATSAISFSRTPKNPRPLLSTTSILEPLQQSPFTVLHALFACGWRVHGGSASDMSHMTVLVAGLPASAKWILKSPRAEHVPRKYLAVLLMLQNDSSFRSFLKQHGVNIVKHGCAEKYYDALLAQQPSKLLQANFQLDVTGPSDEIPEQKVAMAAASSRRGQFRLMESFRWGCISFKYHKRGGLQVDCCRRSHLRRKDDGSHVLCTYSGNFKSEEERLVLIRRMKHFIIEGLAPECKTYEAHRFLQRTIARMPETDLPTNDELDRRAPPMNRPETDDEDLPPVKPAKKRALPKAKAKAQPVAKRARGRGRGRGRGGSDTAARGSADPPPAENASDCDSDSGTSSGSSSHSSNTSSSSGSSSDSPGSSSE